MKTLRPHLLSCLVSLLLVSAPGATRAADTFVNFNEFWFYRDNGDPGAGWYQRDYDHYLFEWAIGISELGFGEGDEFTPINSGVNTAYFVIFMNVGSAANYSNVTLQLRRDDGAIVYLNGVEVFRSNMPTGSVTDATKALANLDGPEELPLAQRVIPASALVDGENLLAVEVHQAEGGNDDMSFAIKVIGHRVGENQPPSANSSFVAVEQDHSTVITLDATDPDNNPLTYTILSGPQHGSLSGTGPNVTYTPNSGYVGPDLFSFQANDGQWDTEVASVGIEVTAASNQPPQADSQNLTVDEDNSLSITLTATDPDGDALSFSFSQPAHGVVTGTGANVTYQPAANYHGPDAFDFTVSDGNGGSATATIHISVSPVNDNPVANAQSVSVAEDGSVGILLTAGDVDGDALTYSYEQPAHGTLSGTGPNLVYQADANYHGPDSFVFTVEDGNGGSSSEVVSITVTPVNDAPMAVAKEAPASDPTAFTRSLVLIAPNNVSAAVVLNGSDSSDLDGDSLTYAWYLGANATPFSTEANSTASISVGSHALTLVVSDGAATASDTIALQVITPCEAVQAIVPLVQSANLKASDRDALLKQLKEACTDFGRGNISGAVRHLKDFQGKVNKKIAPKNPSLAQTLITKSQEIIDAVSGQ